MTGKNYRKTRIVCTIGPASQSEEKIHTLIESGADVFRLNFSHGSHEEHRKTLHLIRKISEKLEKPVGILQDLQGPKIRIGKVPNEGLELKEGDALTITTEETFGEKGKVSTTYTSLPLDLVIGDKILIDDGLIELEVKDIKSKEVHCLVNVAGILKSNKGINLPNVNLSTPALTEKDRNDLLFAIQEDIDFIALSFVRKVEDIVLLKEILKTHGKEIPIIAKIEKPEAIETISEIINESFGIMVARGDLGVEMQSDEVPILQKEIIERCNRKGKPVIIATQMLDSMTSNPRPTRAEASDVANAVLDGADALMLSGETAAGKYPIESAQMMRKIIKTTEISLMTKTARMRLNETFALNSVSEAVSYSAVNIARNLDAKLIACVTHSGQTAIQIARFKSHLPVLAITEEAKIAQKMSLTWGVRTIRIDKIENTEQCFDAIEKILERSEYLDEDDVVIFTAGMPTLAKNSTNMIKVHKIKKGVSKIL